MDREAVAVRVETEAVEVDDHALDLVAAGPQAVRPRGEQRQARHVAGAVAIQPVREREQLLATVAERAAEHPELGQEGGVEQAGGHRHTGVGVATRRHRHRLEPPIWRTSALRLCVEGPLHIVGVAADLGLGLGGVGQQPLQGLH